MTINKAIDHFIYKLQKVWNATLKDQEAINTIINFVNNKHDEQFKSQYLFAKIYITFYSELLKYYKETPSSEYQIAQKELHKTLDKPLNEIIQCFVNNVNDTERFSRIKGKEKINKADVWENLTTYENALEHLNKMVNLALDAYNK